MKIRVLHVLDKISVDSGVSSVVMNYYNNIDHSKITFDFMLNKDVNKETRIYIERNGSKVFIMPSLKLMNIFKYISELKKFYKSNNYQIIHGHVANSAVFYLGLATRTPYRIMHSHNTKASDIMWKRVRNRILTRFVKLFANRYAACSSEAGRFLFGKSTYVEIFNNAIDIEVFTFDQGKRDEIRSGLGLDGKFVIGHMGRFSPQKNHGFLLDIFTGVYKIRQDAVLLLIGDGELREETMRTAQRLKTGDAVMFLGIKDNVSDYMNAMDVFVLPSLFEGLPLAAVEAQASGLPVLISDVVSRDVDINGVTFLSLIKKVWIDRLLAVVAGDRVAASQVVKESCFNIKTQAERLCRYYEGLL